MKSRKKPLKITLGGDPEVHLLDTKGRPANALPVLKCTKKNPIDLGDGIKCYADGVLMEIAFPPSEEIEGVITYLRHAFERTMALLKGNYSIHPVACLDYPKEQLRMKEAWEVGCNPNFDVYDVKRGKAAENMPAEFTDGTRTGSCHIHIGYDKLESFDMKHAAIKLLDIYVGCSSVLFDRDNTAPARRRLYGKAGEFRPTPYGIEYRVLGNYALRTPVLVRHAYELTLHAMNHVHEGTAKDVLKVIDHAKVQEAINGNKMELAEAILAKAALPKKFWDINTRHKTDQYGEAIAGAWGI